MTDPIVAERAGVVTGGVDTHKDVHVAAVVDHLGAVIATRSFQANTAGYNALLCWMKSHGQPLGRVGVEGTGSWGAGLTRHLSAQGVAVVEINRPNRQTRRGNGKTDTIDAIGAARSCLAGLDAGTPKTATGSVEAIRMLQIARRSALTTRTKVMNQIRSVIDTAPEHVRNQYRTMTGAKIVSTAATRRPKSTVTTPAVSAQWALRSLAQHHQFCTNQINELNTQLEQLIAATAPNLINLHCVGIQTAATLIVTAGDNPTRIKSEAAFAALCGVNPLPASSGRTTRHRLNRGGDRQANSALWTIVLARMSHHEPTRAYVQRRTTEGLSKREIMRCLKRYVAREIYRTIKNDLNP